LTVKYKVTHKTWYAYADLVPVCHNLVHLAPRATAYQRCANYTLSINPPPAFLAGRDDVFGNRTEYFSIESAHRELEIVAQSLIEVSAAESHARGDVPTWDECALSSRRRDRSMIALGPLEPMHAQFTFASPRVPQTPELRSYAAKSFTPRRPIVDAIVDLSSRIHADFQFDSRATTVDTPLSDVLRLRRGVCQDFAHLATGCVRAMGIPARYTSGYIRTLPPPGKTRLVGADASHAWCSAWCGPLGWVDFDPTNDCLVGDAYVTVAWGRDYSDVCPIQGVFVGGGEHRISVSVDMAPDSSA
jgi:transglutaminase-like putative cysteine protease